MESRFNLTLKLKEFASFAQRYLNLKSSVFVKKSNIAAKTVNTKIKISIHKYVKSQLIQQVTKKLLSYLLKYLAKQVSRTSGILVILQQHFKICISPRSSHRLLLWIKSFLKLNMKAQSYCKSFQSYSRKWLCRMKHILLSLGASKHNLQESIRW